LGAGAEARHTNGRRHPFVLAARSPFGALPRLSSRRVFARRLDPGRASRRREGAGVARIIGGA